LASAANVSLSWSSSLIVVVTATLLSITAN
jgi:hypothetical protein